MTRKTAQSIDSSLQVDRRGFLTGVSVVLTGLPLQSFATVPLQAAAQQGMATRALHQQMPYFSFESGAESYLKPVKATATRDYVASLSEEEFLRRHWFS